jgi:hypothetical protein
MDQAGGLIMRKNLLMTALAVLAGSAVAISLLAHLQGAPR